MQESEKFPSNHSHEKWTELPAGSYIDQVSSVKDSEESPEKHEYLSKPLVLFDDTGWCI